MWRSCFAIAVTLLVCTVNELMADQSDVSFVESKSDMTLGLRFDGATGHYRISLQNEGPDTEVFADLFSQAAEYEAIPGNVLTSIRINGKLVPDPFRTIDMPGMVDFNPHIDPESLFVSEDHATEICSSCVIVRSFDIREFLHYILERVSGLYAEFRTRDVPPRLRDVEMLAQELDYLSDIRELEVKMSCSMMILSKDNLLLRVETNWISLPPDKYAPSYSR